MRDTGHRAARTRVFLRSDAAVGGRVELPPEEANHIFKVLRAREGDLIELVTPGHTGHTLKLAEVYGDSRLAEAEILEEIPVSAERPVQVTLYQAVPKGKHMDLVVEKATELGVERIVPMLTEHGEVRPGPEKVDRWRRISGAAARQSLQLRIPEVSEPAGFGEILQGLADKEEASLILHNEAGLPTLEEVLCAAGSVALLVGPEGGWSDGELDLALESGAKSAQMGPYRLRSETAGVVAVARAEAYLRDIQGPE